MHEKLRTHMQVCILHYHLRYCAGCKIFRKIFLVYLFYSSSRPLLILLLYLQLMNEDLLQDLVLYKKSHEKAVSIAARSLITLFREVSSYPFAYSVISFCSLQLNLLLVWVQICPSLLVKKDRGRPADPKARPKAFGEATIASDVPGAELLHEDFSSEGEGSDDESDAFDSNDEKELQSARGTKQNLDGSSEANKLDTDEGMKEEDQLSGDEDDTEELDEDQDISDNDSEENDDELECDSDMDEENDVSESDDDEELSEKLDDSDEGSDQDDDSDQDDKSKNSSRKANKRKLSDYIGQLNAADASLRALKKLAGAKKAEASCDEAGKILSDEDFKRIKELKVWEFFPAVVHAVELSFGKESEVVYI